METTVSYDYDDMRQAVSKLRALDSAVEGVMSCGSSEEALSGIIYILRDVMRDINPDDGNLLCKLVENKNT